jgi:nucleoside-triphosphatase
MIVGFSVAGKEAGNPVIRNIFFRTSFRQLPLSIEVAFNTLPFVISNAPTFSEFIKRPVGILRRMIAQTEFWLGKVELSLKKKSNVILVTGDTGDGKSTFLAELAGLFENRNIKSGGIISPALFENDVKSGYELINVATSGRIRLSQTREANGMANVGRFYFFPEGIEFGKNALKVENNLKSQFIFIDEIGAWELQGQGWAASLHELILHSEVPLILAVNTKLVEQVTEAWQFNKPLVIKAKQITADEAFKEIINF